MKFVVLALLALVLSVSATSLAVHVRAPPKAVPADVLAFLEGFALGVEAQIGNITLCTADVQVTLEDFKQGYNQIQQGFKHLSIKLVEEGFISIGHGFDDIATAFKDCGIERLVEDIEKLAAELKTGTAGIIKVLYKEFINIFTHGKEITVDVQNFLKYWKAQQYELAGVAMGKIAGILLEPGNKH
jgi:hypothetical protein